MDSENDERRARARARSSVGSGGARRSGSASANDDPEFDGFSESDDEPSGPIPDMVRKALTVGLAGFFSTEQTVRKALGDTLPKEWINFVTDQSERTRGDLTDAIASEVGRTLRSIDLTGVADQLLTGRTLEVSARIRLLPADDEAKNDTPNDQNDAEGNDS